MSSSSERVGRYQLLEPIGMGPCGTVSRAKVFGVAGFERQFAIKRFHPELTITSVLASQLSSAARSYGSLEHPRIARMSEFGIAQGTTFTAVELVQGLDAARLIAETRLHGGGLAAGGALALVSQAARAVGYAHGRGLSHLGLAPTNVIVTSDGDIKITDFGILAAGLPQRPVDVARLANRIQYLAPEQLANEATSAATDVFALGVIAYEMVTGHRTFSGATPGAIATAILEGPPPEPPLPRPIVRVLHRCLARSPFERFPDARALADALDAALRVAPVPGTRKDIGAQVKATMDRIADMRENEMSGMVALHVGTGPIPRANAPEVATLGRGEMSGTPDDPSATDQFARQGVASLPATGAAQPSGLKPNTTLMGAAPPPIPSMPPPSAPQMVNPPAFGSKSQSTPPPMKGPPSSVPPVIPPIGAQRPIGSQIPKIPAAFPPPVAPQAAPAVPRTPTPGNIPSISRTASSNLPSLPRTMTPGLATPPPLPRTLSAGAPSPPPMAGMHEPPELQRPSEPIAEAPRRNEHALSEYKSSGRIEIEPAASFEPSSPDALSMENLFEDTSMHSPAPDDGADSSRPAPPPAPTVPADARASGRMTPHPHSDRPTSEMPQDFVEKLREEAALDSQDGEPTLDHNRDSLSVQMQVVSPPNELPADTQPGMGVAAKRPFVDNESNEQLTTPVAKTPIRMSTAPASADVPSLANIPGASSNPSPSASTTTVMPEKKSRAGLIAFLSVILVAGLAVGAWQIYERVITAGDPQVAGTDKPTTGPTTNPATTPDAAVAITTTPDAAGSTAPDAAVATAPDAAPAEDAAIATTTPDAAPEPADAAVATTTPDAAVAATTPDASTAPTESPAKTPSEQLVITSKPGNARVYIDGSDVGTTPVKIDGTGDKHTIALLLAGHELYIAEVDGKGSYAIPLKEVTPKGGSGAGVKVIKCKAKERYYVFADGKPTGQMCPTERIVTGLGPHVIEVYDAVTETKNKWDVNLKDDRLSFRIKVE